MPLCVFLMSFINPRSYWKLTKFDFLCGACTLLALLAWGFADSPRTAILLAAIGDGFASLPTLRKAWRFPETGITYVLATVAVIITLPAIPVWNIENSAFTIYLIISNVALLFAVYHKRLRLR